MRAVTISQFDDRKAGLRRYVGDEFICSKARFEEINATGMKKVGRPLVAEAEKEKRNG